MDYPILCRHKFTSSIVSTHIDQSDVAAFPLIRAAPCIHIFWHKRISNTGYSKL